MRVEVHFIGGPLDGAMQFYDPLPRQLIAHHLSEGKVVSYAAAAYLSNGKCIFADEKVGARELAHAVERLAHE